MTKGDHYVQWTDKVRTDIPSPTVRDTSSAPGTISDKFYLLIEIMAHSRENLFALFSENHYYVKANR